MPSTWSVSRSVAPHADAPRRVELAHNVLVRHEGCIGAIFGVGVVGLAFLVPALREVVGAVGGERCHIAEEVVDDVTPVAEHVEYDAAAIGLAVVPGRPLRGLMFAGEYPVAELTAYRQDAAEEARIDEVFQLQEAR